MLSISFSVQVDVSEKAGTKHFAHILSCLYVLLAEFPFKVSVTLASALPRPGRIAFAASMAVTLLIGGCLVVQTLLAFRFFSFFRAATVIGTICLVIPV